MDRDVGERLIDALGDGDFAAVAGCLDASVRMRALVPSGPVEATGPEAATGLLRRWFGDADRRVVLARVVEPLAGRTRLGWRMRVREDGVWLLVDQRGYADVAEGRVVRLDLVCSGFHPEPGSGAAAHFDAGTLGCADGLAAEFRRRVEAIEPGTRLSVRTADPGARRDLPALARMLGHTVTTTETHPDGSVTLTVERRG